MESAANVATVNVVEDPAVIMHYASIAGGVQMIRKTALMHRVEVVKIEMIP